VAVELMSSGGRERQVRAVWGKAPKGLLIF
jgi:hypothetical protein